jgi:hypothetical protein
MDPERQAERPPGTADPQIHLGTGDQRRVSVRQPAFAPQVLR